MLCEKCKKNEATYHYRENVNGAEKAFHLCSECAKEMEKSGEIKGFGKDSVFDGFFAADPVSNVFASLFAPAGTRGQSAPRISEKAKCSLCGASFEELAKEGKAGCPKCYEVFAAELEESIRRIHGRSSHTGRAPAKFREINDAKQKLLRLETELKEAIKNENYEHAAELRDEIRTLRAAKDENGGGSHDVV